MFRHKRTIKLFVDAILPFVGFFLNLDLFHHKRTIKLSVDAVLPFVGFLKVLKTSVFYLFIYFMCL